MVTATATVLVAVAVASMAVSMSTAVVVAVAMSAMVTTTASMVVAMPVSTVAVTMGPAAAFVLLLLLLALFMPTVARGAVAVAVSLRLDELLETLDLVQLLGQQRFGAQLLLLEVLDDVLGDLELLLDLAVQIGERRCGGLGLSRAQNLHL